MPVRDRRQPREPFHPRSALESALRFTLASRWTVRCRRKAEMSPFAFLPSCSDPRRWRRCREIRKDVPAVSRPLGVGSVATEAQGAPHRQLPTVAQHGVQGVRLHGDGAVRECREEALIDVAEFEPVVAMPWRCPTTAASTSSSKPSAGPAVPASANPASATTWYLLPQPPLRLPRRPAYDRRAAHSGRP